MPTTAKHGASAREDDNFPVLNREDAVPLVHLSMRVEAHRAEDGPCNFLPANSARDRCAIERVHFCNRLGPDLQGCRAERAELVGRCLELLYRFGGEALA